MIVRGALVLGGDVIWSEDLNAGPGSTRESPSAILSPDLLSGGAIGPPLAPPSRIMRTTPGRPPTDGASRGGRLAQQLVVRPDRSEDSLLETLKALELQRTVNSEPVLTALRHYPAQAARVRRVPGGPASAAPAKSSRSGATRASTPTSARPTTPPGGEEHRGGDAHGLRQDPLLQPARPRPHPEGRRTPGPSTSFPTKALAQDQLAELYATVEALGADIGTFTYDGDTPQDARKAIRARAHIVVTNPDMLHKGILPHHTKWVKLFENLRYVVVDELHSHRGVYGSHVANVFRRLQRLCRVLRLATRSSSAARPPSATRRSWPRPSPAAR